MAHWMVKLGGSEHDLRTLSKLYTEVECCIAKDDEGAYYLTSDTFASTSEGSEIHTAATNMIRLVNQLAPIRHPNYESVSLDNLTRVNDDGSRSHHVFLSAHLSSSSRLIVDGVVLGPNGQPIPSPEPGIA